MTTATNSESFILEQVLDRPFSEKINAKSVFIKKIWPKRAPIAQKGAKKGPIPSKYVSMGIKLYLHSTRSKNMALEMLNC